MAYVNVNDFQNLQQIMDKYQETYETWNKVATLYQAKFMNLDLYNESYDFICHSISKHSAKLLEIGCGPGNITQYLLSKRPDFDIFATDIAPNMIELAKTNNPTAHFEVMDSRAIDQIKAKFDGVICGFCLPYLSHGDCEKLIVDVANLLDKEGFLYLSFVEGEPEKSGYQVGSSGDRTYFYFHLTETLAEQLMRNHLKLVKVFEIEYPKSQTEREIHTVIIAKQT